MINRKFRPVFDLVYKIGVELISWQSEPNLRQVHSRKDFKTEADRRAHEIFCDGLSRSFPGVPIISEEDIAHSNLRPDEYWLIDPIDGTASWYDGFDGFVSQAALMINDRPKFGVIHCPRRNLTWSAEDGCGGFLNDKRLPKLKSRKSIKFIDNTPKPHGLTKWCMSISDTSGYLECGSIGLKSALVADGTVDIFIKDIVVRDWDLAPAHIILDELGGCLSLLNGNDYIYSGGYEKLDGFIAARDRNLLSELIILRNRYEGDTLA